MTINQFAQPVAVASQVVTTIGGLSPDRQFVLGWANGLDAQPRAFCGIGLCDPQLQVGVNTLVPYLYTKFAFHWDLIASIHAGDTTPVTVPAGTDGADLAIASGSTVGFSTAGVGDIEPGLWEIMGESESSFYKQGAFADRGYYYVIFGLNVQVGEPFQRGDTGNSATDRRKYSNWLRPRTNGSSYSSAIQNAMIEGTSFAIQIGNTGQRYTMGSALFQRGWGGKQGSDGSVGAAASCSPGLFLPFNSALCVGDVNSIKQAIMTATFGLGAIVQADPTNPPISGVLGAGAPPQPTAGTINAANIGTVHIEFIAAFAGFLICAVFAEGCAIPTVQQITLLQQQLGMQLPPGFVQR